MRGSMSTEYGIITVDPEVIAKEFGLSKNAFKRAVGRLLKEKKVKIAGDGIERI